MFQSSMATTRDVFPVLDLPDTAFELVLRFLTFEAVAKLRRVSRRFNCSGKHLLNKGFKNAEKYHMKCLKVSTGSLHCQFDHLIRRT